MVLAMVLFLTIVMLLAWISRRTGLATNGCCAPADPNHDLRMRTAADGTVAHGTVADDTVAGDTGANERQPTLADRKRLHDEPT